MTVRRETAKDSSPTGKENRSDDEKNGPESNRRELGPSLVQQRAGADSSVALNAIFLEIISPISKARRAQRSSIMRGQCDDDAVENVTRPRR